MFKQITREAAILLLTTHAATDKYAERTIDYIGRNVLRGEGTTSVKAKDGTIIAAQKRTNRVYYYNLPCKEV